MKLLPVRLKGFIFTLYIVTVVVLILFLKGYLIYYINFGVKEVIFFSILFMVTETFTVSYRDISISTSFAVQLSVFLLFGPFLLILIQIIGFSVRVTKKGDRKIHLFNTPIYKTFFNYCIFTLPIVCASYVYIRISGNLWNISEINYLAIILFVVVYMVLDTGIISVLVSLLYNKNFLYTFLSNFKLAFLNIVSMAPFGIILSIVFNTYSYIGVIFAMFPIVLARYTFSLYLVSKSQYVQTVDALMIAMEARDKYTQGHSKRVSEIVEMIAKELKFSQGRIEELRVASLLHDVGKIGIEDSILNKQGKLTYDEYEMIKQHPVIGYNILKDINSMKEINYIVKYHHERYDGKGYPEGKKGNELPLEVFIVQLADCIDAMATDRPYRKALTDDIILNEIIRCNGTQFHPKVVKAYLNAIKQKS